MIAALVLLVLPGFVCTRAGDAGPSLYWEKRDLLVHRSGSSTDVTDAEADDALAWAALQWTDVACADISVSVGPVRDDRLAGFDWAAGSSSPDNANVLLFRNDSQNDPIDAWTHQLGALAITTVTYETGTGELLDADIEVNDSGFRFTACEPADCALRHDLKNTLTHEMGHVLGLDHPPDDQPGALEATMYASATEEDLQKRDLAADDEAGLCTLFPTGEAAGNCYASSARTPPPEVRFAPTCGQGWGVCPIASCLGLVFLRGRRRPQMRRSHT